MFKQSVAAVSLALALSGCCPTILLEDWSSSVSSLSGDWDWSVLTISILNFTSDASGDPTVVEIRSPVATASSGKLQVIPDGQSRPLSGTSLEDIVTYVARARATKSGQADTLAENDTVLVEIEILIYVQDQAAFGPCPQLVTTAFYTYSGKFDASGEATGQMVLKLTPSETAGELSAGVASQVSELTPLEPGLTISEDVTMKRP